MTGDNANCASGGFQDTRKETVRRSGMPTERADIGIAFSPRSAF
jgi:hypothetical protein